MLGSTTGYKDKLIRATEGTPMATKDKKVRNIEIDLTSEDFPTFYSQEALVGSSFYDFSVVFFRNNIQGKKAVAGVTFPPTMAKQLAALLHENVRRYEEMFGEIRMPPKNVSTKFETH